MCVDNGMFTVSFLKEGIQKVSHIDIEVIRRLISVPWMA